MKKKILKYYAKLVSASFHTNSPSKSGVPRPYGPRNDASVSSLRGITILYYAYILWSQKRAHYGRTYMKTYYKWIPAYGRMTIGAASQKRVYQISTQGKK